MLSVRPCLLLAALAVLVSGSFAELVRMEGDAKHGKAWRALNTLKSASQETTRLELTFALNLRNGQALHDTLMKVSAPSSADYGKLLTHVEVDALTRPAAEAVDTVLAYLQTHGVTGQVRGGFVRASVDLATAEKLLSARYAPYAHSNGATALRCDSYSLPAEVAAHVAFVSPTVNFPAPFSVQHGPQAAAEAATEAAQATISNTPESLRALYGLGDATGGKSTARQAATAFLHQYYSEADLQAFYKTYFAPLFGTPISAVVGPNGDVAGVEASLDVEYMSVMGSGVATEFWSYAGRQPENTENEPFLDWLVDLGTDADPPLVFSTSYGEDEDSVSIDYATRMNQEFAKNSLRGVTFLFASGDSGVGSAFGACTTFTPQYPSGSPYVLAVGASTGSPETGAGLSSGGFSNRWSQPEWQSAAVATYLSTSPLPDSSLYNATGRGFPDVSAQGTGFVVVNNGQTYPAVAGTSCSSPTFGGVVAMLNDARIAAGKAPMGFINPFFYAYPSILNDVTEGNNPGCGTKGFEAAAGWDPVTGYGTPNFPRMVEAALALP